MPLQRTVRRTDGLLLYPGNQQKKTLPGIRSVQMLGEEIERKEKIMMKFEHNGSEVHFETNGVGLVEIAADVCLLIKVIYNSLAADEMEAAKLFRGMMTIGLAEEDCPAWKIEKALTDNAQTEKVTVPKDLASMLRDLANKKTEEPAAEDVDLEQMTRDAARTAMEKWMGGKEQ